MKEYSIYYRQDGRWETRVPIGKSNDGKRKYRSFYGKTPVEARYKCISAYQYIDDSYPLTELTVTQLTVEWLDAVSSRIKESTAANYCMKIEKHIIPYFGNMQCCLLKSKDVYSFIEEKSKNGFSMRYISDIITLFKSIFRYASREYQIKNIFENIIMPKCKKTEITILTKAQQLKLEKFISKRKSFSTLEIFLSMYMGIRIGELCALQWKDIDLKKRIITVRKTIQRIQVKNHKSKTMLVIRCLSVHIF